MKHVVLCTVSTKTVLKRDTELIFSRNVFKIDLKTLNKLKKYVLCTSKSWTKRYYTYIHDQWKLRYTDFHTSVSYVLAAFLNYAAISRQGAVPNSSSGFLKISRPDLSSC